MGGKKGEKIGDDDFFFQKTPPFRSAHDNYANQRMQRDDTMSNNAPISSTPPVRIDPFLFWKNSSNLRARLFEVMISIIINIEEQVE